MANILGISEKGKALDIIFGLLEKMATGQTKPVLSSDSFEALWTAIKDNWGKFTVDIDLVTQSLQSTSGTFSGYFYIKVGGTKYKIPAYAVS